MTAVTECRFEIHSHPPISPDMVPSDFYLFPKLNSHLCGTQYGSNEGAIEPLTSVWGTRKIPSFLNELDSYNRD